MIKFNKFNVSGAGGLKARVHYSLDNRVDGRKCVTIYAKDYGSELGKLFTGGEYVNDTDVQTDYFDEGRVNLFEGHALYAVARAKVEVWVKEARCKGLAKSLTRHHERFGSGFYVQAGEAGGRTRYCGAREDGGALELLEVASGDWHKVDMANMQVYDHTGRRLYL